MRSTSSPTTDTFGQVILEAQASGLPVVAAEAGGPASPIENGYSGLLAEPSASGLADALLELTQRPLLAERVPRGGLAAGRERRRPRQEPRVHRRTPSP